jgi:hypothetical protein
MFPEPTQLVVLLVPGITSSVLSLFPPHNHFDLVAGMAEYSAQRVINHVKNVYMSNMTSHEDASFLRILSRELVVTPIERPRASRPLCAQFCVATSFFSPAPCKG